uniref:Uncharacterized protein n=1 Tax=Arundo donax TaxID=35708 RepID=A0A0A9PV19_ARUDO
MMKALSVGCCSEIGDPCYLILQLKDEDASMSLLQHLVVFLQLLKGTCFLC